MAEKITYADRPWEKNYRVGPFKLKKTMAPYPEMNVYQFLEDSEAKFPDNVACIFLEEELTYKDLKLKVDKFASGLADLGVKKGKYVATILPNCPQFIISDYAIMKLGAIHVPISVLHTEDTMLHELNESGTEIVICSYRRLERIEKIKSRTKINEIIYTQARVFPDYKLQAVKESAVEGYHKFDNLIEKSSPHTETIEIDPKEDLALLPFTGGTTGLPKGTMLTHYNITTNVIQSIQWMLAPLKVGIIGKSTILVCVPFFHALGHYSLHCSMSWGLKLIIEDPRDMTKIAEDIKKIRPFMVIGVPTHFIILHEKGNLPKLTTFFFSGAAALPAEVAEKFSKKVGVPIGEGYGMTEATAATHLNLSPISAITGFMKKAQPGIGVPVADTDVKIVDPETSEETPFGETGEIWIKGPQVMKGYWPTKGKGLTEDGWLATGDIGKMDEGGFFSIVDRKKDMINVSGNKVYSREIDDVLYEHPAVDMVGVIGVPDPDRPGSERVKAFIQLKKDFVGKVTKEDIIAFCKEKFAPYAVPKSVEFREHLPLTQAMKIHKKSLRDQEIAIMKKDGLLK